MTTEERLASLERGQQAIRDFMEATKERLDETDEILLRTGELLKLAAAAPETEAVSRYRALIKQVEHKGDREHCPWCDAWLERSIGQMHAPECPAFTEEGEVR